MSDTDIPGDPGGLATLASQMRNAASDVESVASDASNKGLDGSWHGTAGAAFHHSLGQLPSELSKAVSAFNDGAGVLSTFANQLAEFQHQAQSYASQIATAQAEQRAAVSRQAQAETNLAKAKLKHSLATDPISLQTLKSAVDVGTGLLHQALANVEDTNATVSRLQSFAASNYSDYQQAVTAAANNLNHARHSGNRSFGGWAGSHVRSLVGDIEHGVGAVRRQERRLVKGAEREADRAFRGLEHEVGRAGDAALRELDRHWATIRSDIQGLTQVMNWITVAADVILLGGAALAAATGVGAPLAVAAVALDGEINAVNTVSSRVLDGVVVGGDLVEASRGNRVAEADLPDDVVDLGIAGIPGKAFGKAADKLGDKFPAVSNTLHRVIQYGSRNMDAEPAEQFGKDVFDSTTNLIGTASAPPIDFVIHHGPTLVRDLPVLISAPLAAPQQLLLDLPRVAGQGAGLP